MIVTVWKGASLLFIGQFLRPLTAEKVLAVCDCVTTVETIRGRQIGLDRWVISIDEPPESQIFHQQNSFNQCDLLVT